MQLIEATTQAPAITSHAGIVSLAQRAALEVKEGRIDPVKMALQLKSLDEFTTQLRALIEEDVTGALQRCEKGKFLIDGAKLEKAEVGVKYDYSGCPKWKVLKAQEEAVAAARKDRETFLKALSRPMAETDMETGETVEVFPAQKTSKTSFKVTLAK